MELTHASFFSGVGGLDRGLELAGWRTVSQSEIEPFPSAVLRSRFPGVPNLGDITAIEPGDIPTATLWSGGFPCQDLSIAGKRAGFTGDRSSLAFTFLNLVEAKRPSWIILENVPGLLSSAGGRDFGRLLGEMDELGYGVAWRILDARYFGVAQRRRRVFIVGSRGSDRAREVLSEPEGSEGDFVPRLAQRAGDPASVARSVTASSGKRHDDDTDTLIAATLNSGGNSGGFRTEPGEHLLTVYRKSARVSGPDTPESWVSDGIANTLNAFDVGDIRTTHAVVGPAVDPNGVRAPYGMAGRLDDTNPAGMDSPRYKAIGNGVVSPVAEWIGRRLAAVIA